ncbi:restriction endonuclease, partial [Candidatus Uhrbacteria bacterium]|nr:restriction endonuclease [Candidatus Uhrbacteria bacterium]
MIADLEAVLTPNEKSWIETENALINLNSVPSALPLFESGIKTHDIERLNKEISLYNDTLTADIEVHEQNAKFFSRIFEGYKKKEKDSVIDRINFIVNDIKLPASFPKIWEVDFDPAQSIAIVETGLPDVVHSQILKEVQLKCSISKKPINQKEAKEFIPNVHPAVILRVAYEIFANDTEGIIKLLVINGWVEYDDPKTGVKTKTYTASLVAEREQILVLNLKKLDPLTAFINLKGKTAGKLIDIIPVTPMMSLNKKDKRFIETKEVLDRLGGETNLAAMDWQDFESLIAELFEKEFADKGAEVKVTQASRDRGVDAVVFDPDPIKGGKFIIQAKRYTNTVDVSAVRDLCAVVKKEGASRGILVTTSSYGADAYTFAQNEPITLL